MSDDLVQEIRSLFQETKSYIQAVNKNNTEIDYRAHVILLRMNTLIKKIEGVKHER